MAATSPDESPWGSAASWPLPPSHRGSSSPDGSVPLAVAPKCQTAITGSHSDWPQVTHTPSQYSGEGTSPVALIWVFVLFSSFLPTKPTRKLPDGWRKVILLSLVTRCHAPRTGQPPRRLQSPLGLLTTGGHPSWPPPRWPLHTLLHGRKNPGEGTHSPVG